MKNTGNENKRIRETVEYEKFPAHLVPKSRFSLSMADNFPLHPDVVEDSVLLMSENNHNLQHIY